MDSSFNLAVHALVCLSHSGPSLSSEALAENICTNPTRVRRVLAGLKKAGMGETRGGLGGGYRRAAEQMSLPAEQTAVVGDQIFTDIAGGNLAGMKSILVEPFEMERHWGFRLKRKLERPILRKLRKKTGREGV